MILLQDNARLHIAKATKVTLCAFRREVLNQAPYSSDLSSCDYYLFDTCRNFFLVYYLFDSLKKALEGQRFTCNQAVHHAVEEWFNPPLSAFFMEGTERRQYIFWNNGGDYLPHFCAFPIKLSAFFQTLVYVSLQQPYTSPQTSLSTLQQRCGHEVEEAPEDTSRLSVGLPIYPSVRCLSFIGIIKGRKFLRGNCEKPCRSHWTA
ncbi:hypothetical protein AVEN_148939-1 [Araneus ventricosus]|uniref:Mariner Mos1 transposase n=1 Tax=Araneus ventricosus TaxID=182803 RepID=A0A4Y2FQJ8_ARAVE|nr:hypothetical protein AVEN_148939-1 [Araneus ventricosus]